MSVGGSRSPPIDLTADDDDLPPPTAKFFARSIVNCNQSSDIIDLTSEPNCESDVELLTVDPCVPRPSAGFDVGSPAPAPSNGRAISTVPTRAICIPHGEIAMPSSETALPSSTTVMPSSATAMPSSTTSIPSLAMAMPSSATAHSDDEDMDEYPDFFSDDDLEREFSQYSNSESGDSFEAMEEMGELADAQESSQNRDTPPEIRHGYESGSLGEVFYDSKYT